MFAEDPDETKLNEFIANKAKHKTKECIIMCNGSQSSVFDIAFNIVREKPFLILKGSGDMADIISTLQKHWLESEAFEKKEIQKLNESIDNKIQMVGDDKESLSRVSRVLSRYRRSQYVEAETMEKVQSDLREKIMTVFQDQIKLKYTILDIGNKLTEHEIINHILQCIFDQPEKTEHEGIEKFEKINVNFLLLCVKLNQLDIADNIGGLWKIALQDKDKKKHYKKKCCLERKDCNAWNKIYSMYYDKRFANKKKNDSKTTEAPAKNKYLKPTEAPVKDNVKNDQKNTSEDIFIHSVLCEKFDVALLIWRSLEHPTHFALYAIEIINQMKSSIKSEHQDHIKVLNKHILEFEQLAIDTVNNTYHKHCDQINNLLTYENENLRNTNCVMLAMKNNCGKFLSQPPCQELNQTLWRCGKLPVNDKKKDENEKILCLGHDVRKLVSPLYLAVYRFFGHIGFLVLFAIWLVSVLDLSTFTWIEFLIDSWIPPYSFELINQWIRNPMRRRKSCWSIFDYIEVAAIVLFILTYLLRIASFFCQEYPLMMVWTRIFFSVDYIMFCLLTLEFCCTSRFLGPKLIIIITMSKVLMQFLLIILVFFMAFTVASQAVLYPNSEIHLLLTFHIFKRPFWSLFGDFSLSDIDDDVSQCTTNPDIYNKYTQLRCPTESGSYYVPALMGAYVIIVNILLINLLIALFNDEITKDNNKSDEIWHHQTITFTFKHSKLIFLPPPFILLFLILLCRQSGGSNSPFILSIPGEITPELKMELLIIEAEQRDKVNLQNDIKYRSMIESENFDELSARVEKMNQEVVWIKYSLSNQLNLLHQIVSLIRPEQEQRLTSLDPLVYSMEEDEYDGGQQNLNQMLRW